MIYVNDLLNSIYETLGDLSHDRWSQDVLLDKLNEGLVDITTRHLVLPERQYASVTAGSKLLNLHYVIDDSVLIRRFYTDDTKLTIPVISEEELSEQDPNWHNKTSKKIEAILLPTSGRELWGVYPKPLVDSGVMIDFYTIHEEVGHTDYIDLPTTYRAAIKHYTIGSAIRDNMDSQNRSFANEQLELYNREMDKLAGLTMRTGVQKPFKTMPKERRR